MGSLRIGGFSRSLPAMAVMAVLATGGAAAAAPRPGEPAAGTISTVAGTGTAGFSGDGGPAVRAELNQPTGIVTGPAGNLVLADSFNNRIRVIAQRTGTFWGQAMTAGHIYTVAGTGAEGFSGDGGPATRAELNQPNFVAFDAAGNLVIADQSNNRIRVIAAHTGRFYGRAMTKGDIYTVAGNGTYGFSGDGGPATLAALRAPADMAPDTAGNLVITDDNNYRVRVVAEHTGTFYGQAMTAGDIYTIAGTGTPGYSGDGGPATSAELAGPDGVAVDGAGNLLICDGYNHRVRVIAAATGRFYGQAMTAGDIYTIAGNGMPGFSGDGGPATRARLLPSSVAFDAAGNLVICDNGNQRIRVVAETTGRFYGQAMTAGDIYTVAGDGTTGFSGDGGPAVRAELNQPNFVAVDGANLLITDRGNNRIRKVTESRL